MGIFACPAVRGGGGLGKFVVHLDTCSLGFEYAVHPGLGDAGDGKGRVCEGRARSINVTPHPNSTLSTLFVYITLYTNIHNADGCRVYTFHIDC
jgi:hypothetical protein